jgi:hypothetical protein
MVRGVNMELDPKLPILKPWDDHQYTYVVLSKGKAVYNERYYSWSDYVGDEYLDEGDKVYEVYIVT